MNPPLGIAMGLVAAASWGAGSMMLRSILDTRGPERDFPRPTPAAVNFFKNSLALAAFLVLWAVVGGRVESASAWWGLAVSGAFGFAIGDTLFFGAIGLCGVQTTAVVAQLNVPLSVLMCWLFLDEALAPATLVSIGAALIGVWLVILSGGTGSLALPETSEERARRLRGVLLAFGAALSFATSILLGHGSFEQADLVAGSLVRLVGGLISAAIASVVWARLRQGNRAAAGSTTAASEGAPADRSAAEIAGEWVAASAVPGAEASVAVGAAGDTAAKDEPRLTRGRDASSASNAAERDEAGPASYARSSLAASGRRAGEPRFNANPPARVAARTSLGELLLPLRDPRVLRALLPAATFASVLSLLPFGYSLKVLEGGTAAVLGTTTPIFTLAFAFLGRGERPRPLAVVGTLIVFAGVAGLVSGANG